MIRVQQYEFRQRERDNYVFIIEKKEEEDIPDIPLHDIERG